MYKKQVIISILFLLLVIPVFLFFKHRYGFPIVDEKIYSGGVVIDFNANKHEDIDGIIIKTKDNKNINLRFPPHMAQKIMNIADKNDFVKVVYHHEYVIFKNNYENRLASITNKNKYINFEENPPLPPLINEGYPASVEIKKYKFNIDDRNNPDAIISEGYFIAVRPHILQEISPLMTNSNKIYVKGLLRNKADGFVNYYGYKFLKAESITLDDKTFLLR